MIKFKRIALDLLFPQWCLGCGREGGYICQNCCQSLPSISSSVCPRCGKPQADENICPSCSDGNSIIDGIRAPFVFDGIIRRAINELKYHNLRALASPLAAWLNQYLQENPVPGEVLVPVPLHRKRLKERGYNQSALLAKELGKITGLSVVADALFRRRHTLSQARTASVEERRQNVTDAFSSPEGRFTEKHVILIDDVATSGATLNACAHALKASGAAGVCGLVVAIEP